MGDPTSGLTWQVGVWDRISQLYWEEIDPRFEPVVAGVLTRASLQPGERVLDLGTGTGVVAARAASEVGADGDVLAVDISPEMLALARKRLELPRVTPYRVQEGGAENIPTIDGSLDAVLASLSIMYVINREAAAREIARVLSSGGRFVAAVWAGPDVCDIVKFQQTAGSFAPPPPVQGVGPGALADAAPFIAQLGRAGIEAQVETEILGFEFPDFTRAWEVLAGVTTAQLPEERREEAKAAVQAAMWPDPDEPREFRNTTQFIVGRRL